jgi:LmbE family N-acetylglucosaminyl deacetylase
MTRELTLSIIGHVLTILSFLGVAVYAFLTQRNLHRTTRNSHVLFYITIGISFLFASLNLYRLIYEFDAKAESPLSTELDSIAQYSGILVQSGLILALLSRKIIARPGSRSASILAIGAHPDDIEIAAGATLAKMNDAGYCIDGLILTHGEKGGDRKTRPVEAKRGAEFIGLDTVEVLDFTDAHLSDEMIAITNAIEEKIAQTQPGIILTHSIHDLHQDHQAVYQATMRAARSTRVTILCYESPSVTQDFHPTYFIDVEKYVNVKIQAVREHWDQRNKPYMKPELLRGKLVFRGSQAKVDYAEGFEVARMVSAI